MSAPITLHLFGGVNDGKDITIRIPGASAGQITALWQGQVAHEGGGGFKPTQYVESPEWSAHFGRPVAIPANFPGRPPKQLSAA